MISIKPDFDTCTVKAPFDTLKVAFTASDAAPATVYVHPSSPSGAETDAPVASTNVPDCKEDTGPGRSSVPCEGNVSWPGTDRIGSPLPEAPIDTSTPSASATSPAPVQVPVNVPAAREESVSLHAPDNSTVPAPVKDRTVRSVASSTAKTAPDEMVTSVPLGNDGQ